MTLFRVLSHEKFCYFCIFVKTKSYNSFVEKCMERDNYMSPTEAKEFGLIDKILAHPMQDETKTTTEKTDSVAIKS